MEVRLFSHRRRDDNFKTVWIVGSLTGELSQYPPASEDDVLTIIFTRNPSSLEKRLIAKHLPRFNRVIYGQHKRPRSLEKVCEDNY